MNMMIFIDSANFSSFFFFSFLEKQGKHLDNRLGRLVFTLRDIKNRSICRKESIKSWRIFRFTDISLITSLFFSGVWKHICINVQFLWRQVAMATTFIPVDPLHYTSQQREGSRFPVGFVYFSVPRHIDTRNWDFTRGYCYANDKADIWLLSLLFVNRV